MGFFNRFFPKSRTAILHVSAENGFHLRPAARFASEAKRFSCRIEAESRGEIVDAKNLNALLSLNLEKGDHFDLICKGKDADEAVKHLVSLFDVLMHDDTPNTAQTHRTQTGEYQGETIPAETVASGVAVAPLWFYEETTHRTDKGVDFAEAIYRTEKKLLQSDSDIAQAHAAILASLLQGVDNLDAFKKRIEEIVAPLRGGHMEAKIIDYYDILRQVESEMGIIIQAAYPNTPFILVADDLLPSQVESLPVHTEGVILQKSAQNAHSAILLRASAIPSLLLREDLPQKQNSVILDADAALLVLSPSKTDMQKAKEKKARNESTEQQARTKRFESATTNEGVRISVFANVTDIASAKEAKESGAEGIGLLRTEFLFTEEEPSLHMQIDAYDAIFSLFEEITVRTLDIGGDKALPYVDLPEEANPFLGIRGVRLFRTHPDIMTKQLRAIFTASRGKRIKVMFPMVSTVDEFEEAKQFASEVAKRHELDISRIDFGIMVETPSVLFQLEAFDRVVDFYSVGSNDLNQYLHAIERTHPKLSLDPHAEALFNAIDFLMKRTKKPVGICGEIAGDKEAIPRLIGMGLRQLSVSPKRIAMTKEYVRHV